MMATTKTDNVKQDDATVASGPQTPGAAGRVHGRRELKTEHSHAPPAHGRYLYLLALTALGVVYGDIGTSPLYALRECFYGLHAIAVTPLNIFGVLSLIFWSLIIVITIKYIVFILRADNHGEGGILALTALATPIRRLALSPQRWLVLMGVFGAALLYGDGVITPAISVLSAVEGLKMATPLFEPYVIPLTLAILIGLFLIQSSGTARIGRFFGPIMFVWFVVLALLGIVHIVQDPSVLGAVSPGYALAFFAANGWHGFLILGTVFLVVTGGEALYADMGHFGRRPIRFAWFTVVLPALLLNYFGQGSLLLREPEAAEHVFYQMAPSWALFPMVALATLATIIASQALISGAFSLTMQAENLGFLPRLDIIHTSASAYGQIYIPFVNWALMIACIGVVLIFRSSSNLAAAYGIAVTSTMAITTIIFGVVTRRRWRWPLAWVIPIIGCFLIVDLAFLGANAIKIPQGGWFTLAVAIFIYTLMTTWKRGNWLVFNREQDLELSLPRLLKRIRSERLARTPGTAIFLSANPRSAPAALLANLRYNGVLHERVLLVTVETDDAPHVRAAERLRVEPLEEGLYQIKICYGFMQRSNVPYALALLKLPDGDFHPDDTPYFVNRTRVIATKKPGMALWREHLYTLMRRNSTSAADFFSLPPNRVFEIGTTIEL
jgi:KUP system potassium uptake protein